MILRLLREQPNGLALQGTLTVDGVEFCATLENNNKCLAQGWYPVHVTQSPKFGRLLPILGNTATRTGIRIHRGTQPKHSAGCILVPPDKEQTLTTLLLHAQQARETIYIDIQNHDPAPLYDVPCPMDQCAPRNNSLDNL